MADVEVKKLKIAELRKELTDRGLSSKGNKAELVERLTEFLDVGGGDAVLDNEVDADVLTADDEVEDLLNQDEELDGVDEPEVEVATRKVELEIEEEIEEEEVQTKVEAPEIKKVISPTSKPLTDIEKKALRAQKFGGGVALSDADKKKARAERFGMQATGSQAKPTAAAVPTTQSKGISISVDTDKLKQRAERFGKSVSPTAIKTEEAERIRKRKERFGAVTITAPGSKDKSGGGGDDAEAKKRKRAERFGMA